MNREKGAETETYFVIAAPYWDLSFPAMLKQYLEQINVVGITFKYTEDGVPAGLCKANRMFYVTTAGGCYVPDLYGFEYVRTLAQNFYGIQDVRKIEAVGLDIEGADVGSILRDAKVNGRKDKMNVCFILLFLAGSLVISALRKSAVVYVG